MRRRMSKKQPPPAAYLQDECLPVAGDAPAPYDLPEDKDALRKLLKQMYYQLEKWRGAHFLSQSSGMPKMEQTILIRPLKELPQSDKQKLVAMWMETKTPWCIALSEIAGAWATNTLNSAADKLFFRGTEGLFTYNGDWGVLDREALLGPQWPPLQDVVDTLRCSDVFELIARRICALIDDVKQTSPLKHWAWSIELCTETYTQAQQLNGGEQPVYLSKASQDVCVDASTPSEPIAIPADKSLRLHVHLFVSFHHRHRIPKAANIALFDSTPLFFAVQGRRNAGRLNLSGNGGFFYVQVRKKSTLRQGANTHPFTDYLVNPEWVMNLWQMGKVSEEVARQVIISCKKNVPNLLRNHETVMREQNVFSLQHIVGRAHSLLEGQMQPVRTIPEVEAWKATFKETAFRYKFLVLDGPSQMGKTLFCRSLSPDQSAFVEVDCAYVDMPDLKEFKSGIHRVVLCDEGSCDMVLRYKKLFQYSASYVTMGSSRTNCHASTIWAHGVMFVIASNKWRRQLEALEVEDAAWLAANSVYVPVTEPLWQERPVSQSQSPDWKFDDTSVEW